MKYLPNILLTLVCIYVTFSQQKMPRIWIFRQWTNSFSKDSVQIAEEAEKCQGDETHVLICEQQDGIRTEDSVLIDPDSENKNVQKDLPALYYAVSLPSEIFRKEDEVAKPLVFVDKKEALQAVKKYKGSRFKTFRSEKDAINFSSEPVEQTCGTPKPDVFLSPPVFEAEKNTGSSTFKGPKSQDLVKLRKAIESGNSQHFLETVWSNPRYLISSGDTPSILQEGSRYNALHVAAKHKRVELCKLIIKTIEDPNFMELLYDDDTEDIRLQRTSYITDLYINMPDKGLCETPLHFASKFGCLEVVQLIASHPACDKSRKNKYGLTAKEIICERCPASSKELKQQISEAFEDKYFVPVLRSEDNSVQPFIGKPYSQGKGDVPFQDESCSPQDAKLTVMAVAGPMSPSEAEQFYRCWKTPTAKFSKLRFQELNRVRLRDTEKGLERMGRQLAHSTNTPWKEYWPALNTWCDLSSSEGLEILENHLKTLHWFCTLSLPSESCSVVEEDYSNVHCSSPQEGEQGNPAFTCSTPSLVSPASSNNSSGISTLCHRLECFHIDDQGDKIITSPDMPKLFLNDTSSSCDTYEGSDNISEMSFSYSAAQNNCSLSQKELKQENINNNHNAQNLKISEKSNMLLLSDLNCQKEKDTSYVQLECKCALNENASSFETENEYEIFKYRGENHKSIDCEERIYSLFASDIQYAVRNITEALSEITLDSNLPFTNGTRVHELLCDIFPKLHCLFNTRWDCETFLHKVHCEVGFHIFREMEGQLLEHEIKVIYRYVKTYLDSRSVSNLSDDDEEYIENGNKISQKNSSVCNDIKWEHLKCILNISYLFYSGIKPDYSEICKCRKLPSCDLILQKLHDQIKPEEKLSISEGKVEDVNCKNFLDFGSQSDLCSSDSEDSDNFVTPPSSPDACSFSSEEEPVTPEEGIEVYIGGKFPTKDDADILRAVEDVYINPEVYPHIFRWKTLVSSKGKNSVESWPSPSVKRYREKMGQPSESFVSSPSSSVATPIRKFLYSERNQTCFQNNLESEEKEKAFKARKLIKKFDELSE